MGSGALGIGWGLRQLCLAYGELLESAVSPSLPEVGEQRQDGPHWSPAQEKLGSTSFQMLLVLKPRLPLRGFGDSSRYIFLPA